MGLVRLSFGVAECGKGDDKPAAFVNWGRESYHYASLALHKIGAKKMASIVDQCQALIDEHFDLEERRRNSRISIIHRYEWVERCHPDLAGKLGFLKNQLCNGIRSRKFDIAKVRQTGEALSRRSETECFVFRKIELAGIGRGQIAIQHSSVQNFLVLLRFDGKMREAIVAPFVRAIVDFPINEPPVSGKPDAPCPDSTYRKGNLVRLSTLID